MSASRPAILTPAAVRVGRPRCARRAGTAYVLVLGASTMLTVMAAASVIAGRVHMRTTDGLDSSAEARSYARSGLDVARLWIQQDPKWRTNRTAGTWASGMPIGRGTFSVSVVNPNAASLNNSPMDPVTVTTTGSRGDASHSMRVTLVPEVVAHTALQTHLFTVGNQTFSGSGNGVVGNGIIGTNGNLSATATAFNATNIETTGTYTFSSATGSGMRTSGVAARTFPDSSAFDYYVSRGTAISITSLPLSGGVRLMNRALLAPTFNSLGGGTNASGIYVIDCQGQQLTIQNSRILGTLVLLNATSAVPSSVAGSVNWSAATTGQPALLVQGALSLAFTNTTLNEAASGSLVAMNFNPAAVPYNGASDTDTVDTYPSSITGLIYASGALQISNKPTITGVVIGGTTLSCTAAPLTITYDQTYLNNPPPGFFSTKMKLSGGSWRAQ